MFGGSATLRLILPFVCVLLVSADQVNMTATIGETVILPCRAPNNKTIVDVEWSRTDLKKEYVLLYRDRRLDPDEQNASFMNRVELQDRQMKDGNVSLILENVTTADSGIFEARVKTEANRTKRAYLNGDLICIFNLSVDPPGQPGRDTDYGAHIGVIIAVCVIGLFVCVCLIGIHKKCSKKKSFYPLPKTELV